jgi:polysaccharide deacetylase 2 family uncharacterized protein YibQ
MRATLVHEVEMLIEELMKSDDREKAAKRLLVAFNLLRTEMVLMNHIGDTSRNKLLLALMGKLTMRAAELMGDDGPLAQMVIQLESEAAGLKVAAATVGM